MAKTSGLSSSGNSRRAGASKQELRAENYYNIEYTFETVLRLIHNKGLIISNRDNGSYSACEILIDLENIEREYLSDLQREIIRLKYEKMLTNTEIGDLLGIDRRTVTKIILDIESTLREVLPHDI